MDLNDSDPFEGWIPTPPRTLGNDDKDEDVSAYWVLDPALEDNLVSPSEGSLNEIPRLLPRERSINPSSPQPARKNQRALARTNKNSPSHPFEFPESAGPREGLWLKSLMSQMPTKRKGSSPKTS